MSKLFAGLGPRSRGPRWRRRSTFRFEPEVPHYRAEVMAVFGHLLDPFGLRGEDAQVFLDDQPPMHSREIDPHV
ncbi:hypothetical protein [Oharaeibacter diazotrophicus]|uniref:Uncharacterized protein n=1 Tax=Oharaeibacter diazotrophicus TaxID=1920512 RepID=A0A4R6RCP3_9HYPH|nr:hypothetical protein [Oharaeibacter diazotrophicus]TDP83892.1 hypothetical protein EDD54_2489 [Oharaeibacter diazotrophicus]BBE72934.1 hypothetical protein OHA_1_02538 [Pleomorphomonas sp. SM30]GLS74713.1 hypothetical protein GCM10007904_00480 [Oharaeibacter diazotrophicus]